jgi:hypothetical protein
MTPTGSETGKQDGYRVLKLMMTRTIIGDRYFVYISI